jgi:hypothetical protein
MKTFWNKVNKTSGCWLWTAGKHEKGYGTFWVSKKCWKAHRYAWHLKHGKIPSGLCVLHKCDNPPCVNPDHLFLGTVLENNIDMFKKGRNSKPPPMAGWNRTNIPSEAIRLFGFMADTEIARQFSLTKSVVAKRRRSMNIQAFPCQTKFKMGNPHPRWSQKGGSPV